VTYRPRANCIRCGVSRAAAGGLSRSGKCQPCGEEALAGALLQLAQHTGPVYERWLDRLTDAVARLQGERQIPVTLPDQPYLFDYPEESECPTGRYSHMAQ